MRVNLGPTWLVLPIDDTTNSTCPKRRRAKPSRQTSSNQRVQDTIKFRPDAEMHNNWHLQLANAILMVLLQSLFFAKTQTAAGSGSKRLSRPHGKDSLDTKDCNETPPTPLTPRSNRTRNSACEQTGTHQGSWRHQDGSVVRDTCLKQKQ